MTPHTPARPQGWYRDRLSTFGHRYWDGQRWFQYAGNGALLPCV